jgi:hypothetical protein
LRCFDGTTGHAAKNQNADSARLLQTRGCRKSIGRFCGQALSIYNGAASDEDTVKNQIVGDQTESLWSEINEYKVERQTLKRS